MPTQLHADSNMAPTVPKSSVAYEIKSDNHKQNKREEKQMSKINEHSMQYYYKNILWLW